MSDPAEVPPPLDVPALEVPEEAPQPVPVAVEEKSPPVTAKPYKFYLSRAEGGPPVILESDNKQELFAQAYKEILKAQRGWAHFILDGVNCPIYAPKQLFAIPSPTGDNTVEYLNDPSGWVGDMSGKFTVLVEPPEGIL